MSEQNEGYLSQPGEAPTEATEVDETEITEAKPAPKRKAEHTPAKDARKNK
jgi:hypothetical protein